MLIQKSTGMVSQVLSFLFFLGVETVYRLYGSPNEQVSIANSLGPPGPLLFKL